MMTQQDFFCYKHTYLSIEIFADTVSFIDEKLYSKRKATKMYGYEAKQKFFSNELTFKKYS